MNDSELSKKDAQLLNLGYGGKLTLYHTAEMAKVVPQEIYTLTQVILNTLNSEPNRFHDMGNLPGLENRDWHQLGQIARYLLKQRWIEVKVTRNGFLIKLTIQGKVLVCNHDGSS
jgi:hypothetical protein